MNQHHEDSGTESATSADASDWRQVAMRYLTIAAACLVGALIAAAIIPRWWARRLGDWIDGSLAAGSLIGIVMGFVCTLVPVLLLAEAIRRRARGAKLLWISVPALVLVLPVLATLWVAIGAGSGAKAGRRILDVDGPGVRGGTLVGVLLGVAAAAALIYLLWSRRRARTQAAQQES